jgi:hypothetical protein
VTRTLAAVLGILLALAFSAWQPVLAQQSPPGQCYPKCPPNVKGGNGSFDAGVIRGISDTVPGRGTPATHGDAPGRREWKTVEEFVTPSCFGNSFNGADALCMAALVSCPGDDQIRYWVWHRETNHTRDEAGNVTSVTGQWFQEPGSYCLGPDDPGVPTIGQVIARVQSDFRNLPLPVAGIQVDPTPTSLVNIPTAFFAGGAQTASFNPTILGTTVTINAKPTSWQWAWGDGSSSTTSTPGVPKRPMVSHEYGQPRDYAVSVATTWTGTFTVAGTSEVFPIRTPAVVQSGPVTVQVREARTQLVDR